MVARVGCEVYTKKHLKRKLIDRYGHHIVFPEVCGRKNVICFKDMCSFILNDKWYSDRDKDVTIESYRIVKSAAKLIAAEIRDLDCDLNHYSTANDIHADDSKVVPPLLQLLMQILVPSPVKRAALSQCIMQAARPRSILAPILFGLSVEMDHAFDSKFLTNELARLGLCVSYDEVLRYKQSIMMSHTSGHVTGVPYPTAFTQWVADNVDHNVRTLDGLGTFHGMGIISGTTSSGIPLSIGNEPIPRLPKRKTIAIIGSD